MWASFGLCCLRRQWQVEGCGDSSPHCRFQLAQPDIAEANGITVKLQRDGAGFGMGFVVRGFGIAGGAVEFEVVEQQNSVLDQRNVCGPLDVAISLETGGVENDLVGIPFTGFAHGIGQRGRLFVDRARLAVEVGLILERVKNLNFIESQQVTATVAAALSFSANFGGCRPFEVQLDVPEVLSGGDGRLFGRGNSIFDGPFVAIFPCVEVPAVEQDDGV